MYQDETSEAYQLALCYEEIARLEARVDELKASCNQEANDMIYANWKFAQQECDLLKAETTRLMLCLEHLSLYVSASGDTWVQVTAKAYMGGASPYDRGVTGDWVYSSNFLAATAKKPAAELEYVGACRHGIDLSERCYKCKPSTSPSGVPR